MTFERASQIKIGNILKLNLEWVTGDVTSNMSGDSIENPTTTRTAKFVVNFQARESIHIMA